jgi:centromeric protein E
VVQIVVESRERISGGSAQEKRTAIAPGGVRVSTLSLIDLAGSERAAESKERRTEGAHINKSLLTLGTVIARLTTDKEKAGKGQADGKHLPYRDSKLTRLLQPALSGNSLVSILCTVQLGSGGSSAGVGSHTGETLNTLKFAARAKNNIVSHAKRAEESLGNGADAGSRVLLERYRHEIQSLRAQLEQQTKESTEQEEKLEEKRTEDEANARHEEQMLEMQLARTALKERIEHLNRLILCSKSTGVNTNGTMAIVGGMAQLMGSIGGGDARSLRSSASQSTLGMGHSLSRTASMASVRSTASARSGRLTATGPSAQGFYGNPDDDEDTIGEFADGTASVQRQVSALQADLADKNRYISTLERRLLQARRSSHSRMSMGLSQFKNPSSGSASVDDPEVMQLLREKDVEIADLRMQLDDKDRMVTALRSAARQRDVALAGSPTSATTPILGPVPKKDGRASSLHQSTGSNSSSVSGSNTHTNVTSITSTVGVTVPNGAASPALLSPVSFNGDHKDSEREKESEKKRRSVDEVSRMLDEMIQDRVESGQIVRGPRGTMRVRQRNASGKKEDEANTPAANEEDQSKVLGAQKEQAAEVSSG